MPNNKGSVNIGLSIAYQKTLEEMTSAFKSRLTALSNEFKKVGFSKDVGEQFDAVYKKIDNVSTEMRAMFDTINKNKLDASQFEQYQLKVTKEFGKIETSISNLNKKLDILGGADFSSDIIKQVNDLKNAYKGLDQVLGLIEPSSGKTAGNIDSSAIESYKKTLEQIKKVQKEVENTTFDGKNNDEIHAMLKEEEQALKSSLASYKKLQTEIQAMSSTDPGYHQKKNELVGYYLAIYQTADALEKLEQAENDNGGNFTFDKSIRRTLDALMDADTKVDNYAAQIRKIIQTNKNASDSLEQTQGTFDTFQIKNGAIHVPIEIDKADANLKRQLQETIGKLQTEADNNSIIAKVKLTLDGASSKGYKKNAEMDKQQQEGQNEPALDFAGAINKKYREAAREAETLVKQQIRQIQSELKEVKIRIKPDDKAFVDDLSKMVNTSLKEIAKKTSGLNVNKELEQLISNLKEVSTSLVGNENFKLGLDEASINRITAAIENMANMIQRAFGVASDGDIAAQWTAIESKFKGVAGEEGKLLKSNKEHKLAIQELAIEYKKYIDMGGKNDLSELTTHKQTIKNIANEYENLGKAAQEASQKQESVAKKKVSSEEAESIKGVTRENKNLEKQADRTGTALGNEGNVAQTAAERFAELAEKKKAATDANLELGIAAEMTTNALKEEIAALKETEKSKKESKPNKNAIDGTTYANNFLKWQRDIKQSLIDSGNYAEVYEAKISQAANGTVKFTATVLDSADKKLKKFSAKVNDLGSIFAPSADDMNEKEVALFEKRQRDAEKLIDAMAAMEGGAEKPFLNRAELEQSIVTLIEAEEELDRFKIKKVSLEESGKLAITTEIKEANGQVKTFIATFDSIGDIIDEETGSVKNFAKVIESAYDSGKFTVSKSNSQSSVLSTYEEIYDIAKKLSSLDVKIAGLDSNKNANQVQELTSQYKELEETYTKLVTAFFKDADVGKLPIESVKELNDVFESAANKIAEIKAKFKDVQTGLFENFEAKWKSDINFDAIASDLNDLKAKFANVGEVTSIQQLRQDLSALEDKLKNIKANESLGKKLNDSLQFKDINEVRASIDSLFASIGKVDEKSIRVEGTDKLTAEIKQANGEIRKMTVSLDSDGFARYVDNGIVQFGRLRRAAEGVFKGIKNLVRIYLSPQDFVRYFRQGFDAVKDIDTAMTELRKVSDASNSDLASYFDDATESAKKLGSSVSDMIGATADWSRMGYNLPDSKQLGEIAVLYKNVGDGISVEEANSSLTSTLQGFQMSADEATKIVDAFNEVSNNYAISSGGIGEALKRSAAAFNAANTDMNQAIALITAGNEVIQNPEKIGTMWQTVSARIRGTKSDLEELGESTENVLSTSKLRSLVAGYTGVDIMKDDNTYKDMYTIIKEIGEEWEKLNDIEQAALLEGLAGKKQSNALAAVLNNYKRLEEIYETAEGSAGSAEREQLKYTQSLQYSLDQLTAHGEEFWSTFINKDDVKEFIDLLNNIIEKATAFVETFGSIPTTAGILGAFASIKNVGINMLVAYLSNYYCFELPTI